MRSLVSYAGKVFLARVFPSRETNPLSVSSQGSGRICTLPIREEEGLYSGVGPMRGSPGQVVNLTVAGGDGIRTPPLPKSYVLDRWFLIVEGILTCSSSLAPPRLLICMYNNPSYIPIVVGTLPEEVEL